MNISDKAREAIAWLISPDAPRDWPPAKAVIVERWGSPVASEVVAVGLYHLIAEGETALGSCRSRRARSCEGKQKTCPQYRGSPTISTSTVSSE